MLWQSSEPVSLCVLPSQFPQGSDQSWLQKLSSYLEASPLFEKPRLSNEAFVIQHFADKVRSHDKKTHQKPISCLTSHLNDSHHR